MSATAVVLLANRGGYGPRIGGKARLDSGGPFRNLIQCHRKCCPVSRCLSITCHGHRQQRTDTRCVCRAQFGQRIDRPLAVRRLLSADRLIYAGGDGNVSILQHSTCQLEHVHVCVCVCPLCPPSGALNRASDGKGGSVGAQWPGLAHGVLSGISGRRVS